MSTVLGNKATLDDLFRVEGKAELIRGRIVSLMPSGILPSQAAFRIAMSLSRYAESTGHGFAFPDGIGYAIAPPLQDGRQSFSPDASYFAGQLPANRMRFVEGPPTVAIEVRSENDYGPSADMEIAAKRADYFEAGTIAVWDVDPIAETVTLYQAADPTHGVVFHRGDTANAASAVHGWSMSVDSIFG